MRLLNPALIGAFLAFLAILAILEAVLAAAPEDRQDRGHPPWVCGGGGGYRELQLMDLEGVEVYRGRWEKVEGYFPSDCGMIFLWRRPDWGHPLRWGKALVAGGLLGALIVLAVIL